MEQNRFFKFIWRANGVLIFLTALLILGFTIFLFFETLIPTFKDTTPPPQVTTAASAQTPDKSLKLKFEHTRFDEKYVFIDLYSEEDGKGLKSYGRTQTQNLGIHDLSTGETNWIFPNNNQHIKDKSRIIKTIKTETKKTDAQTLGHFLVTATTSTDGDVIRDVWVSSADGLDTRKIISDVSVTPKLVVLKNNQARILVKTDEAIQAIDFDIETRTIGKSTIIKAPQ